MNTADNVLWDRNFPKIERLLEKLVSNFIDKNNLNRYGNNRDDILQEAKVAALLAMRSYDKTKKAKLSTHITNCVINRFRDLWKISNRKIKITYTDDYLDEPNGVFIADHNQIDHAWVMENILTPEEHDIYLKIFVFGYTPSEVAEIRHRMVGGKYECQRRKITMFLRRILAVYQSKGQNPQISILENRSKRSEKEIFRSLKKL